MKSKSCTGCNENKKLSEYHRDKNSKDLHSRRCKVCTIAYMANYRKNGSDGNKGSTKPDAARRRVLKSYKCAAERRDLPFKLTEEYFFHLTKQNCFYCGIEPGRVRKNRARIKTNEDSYTYNGIDRMDNSKGYVMDNVCPCCTDCNRAKQTMTVDQFLAWGARMVAHMVRDE